MEHMGYGTMDEAYDTERFVVTLSVEKIQELIFRYGKGEGYGSQKTKR